MTPPRPESGRAGTARARARLRLALSLTATMATSLASPAAAQPVRVGALRGPADELDYAFTRITSVRELPDGRLLVADAGEDVRLAMVDWRSGAVRTLGREGAGPGEYRSVGRLVPLGGDSTLLEDRRTGRWLLLAGERFVATARIPIAGGGVPVLAGADARGRVLRLGDVSFGRMPGMSRPLAMVESADTVAVVLARRDAASGDTIARIRGRFGAMRSVRKPVTPGGAPIPWFVGNPLATSDHAWLFADGWTAVAFADPYRVEWRSPDGRRAGGRALPFVRVPVDARQKRAALAREYAPSVGMTEADVPPWPPFLPPFLNERTVLLAEPAGRVIVRRTPDAARPGTFYDVVDRSGALVARVALGEREHLVGFGARSVYVVETDDDGLQWLRRHPWP